LLARPAYLVRNPERTSGQPYWVEIQSGRPLIV
jgi:hypothetical protein